MTFARSVALVLACSTLGVAALTAAPRTAHAQDSEATATALFDEGRNLMAQHRYAEACPKLAASQRLSPSGGTLINLGECYEHTGQTASAWAAWKTAAARANAAGKAAAEKSAVARAIALEPTLARLAVVVGADSDVVGLEVRRDGVPVGHDEFGSLTPVDPGPHVIGATAPKKKAFSARVDVAPKQADASVHVVLVDDPDAVHAAAAPLATPPVTESPAAAPPPASHSSWSTQKTIGVVVAGAGVVGIAVGSVFGLSAKSKNDDALANCRTSTLCNSKGLSLTSDAKSAATASTIAFAVGGVALATGVVLWLTAPSSGASSSSGSASASTSRGYVHAAPVLAPSYGGLAVGGAF